MSENTTTIINQHFVLEAHQQYNKHLSISGNVTLENYAAMYAKTTVERGIVSLGDFAFINELYMPLGGEIFFYGKRPLIRCLDAPHLTVHICKKCERWTDFVQINNARNVIIRRDIG